MPFSQGLSVVHKVNSLGSLCNTYYIALATVGALLLTLVPVFHIPAYELHIPKRSWGISVVPFEKHLCQQYAAV